MAMHVWPSMLDISTAGAAKGTLAAVVLISLVFLVTYTVTSIEGMLAAQKRRRPRSPPTIPVYTACSVIDIHRTWYGAYTPARIRLGNVSYNVVSGPNAISSLFRNSKRLANQEWLVHVMVHALGLPRADAPLYLEDDTGSGVKPYENAKMTDPDRRIFYLHRLLYTSMAGPGLDVMTRQLIRSLTEQISECEFEFDHWTEIEDLYGGLIRKMTFKATVISLCGPHIFTVNPDLDEDFWNFDSATLSLLRWPWWMVPGSSRAREKMKQSVTRWQRFAEKHYDTSRAAEDPRGWEEYFGSKIMRLRYQSFHKLSLSEQGYAAEDVGMLWAAGSNVIPAVMWFVLEVVQHPEVLARVREDIAPCIKHDSTNRIVDVDVTRLCSNPLLQSIYAEVLRMQVGIALPLTASVPECSIEGWSFKQGETILASTWHAGRDQRVWNTGTVDDPHPVDEFWAERFLVKPNDPVHIGPVKRAPVDKDLPEEETTPSSSADDPRQSLPPPENDHHHDSDSDNKETFFFSLSGTAGSWIPFGGGVKLCPGRHFAKQEMIVASAMFLDAFDIELSPRKKRIVPDDRFFPFGNMPPKGKIGARVRRRRMPSTV